MEYVAAGDLSAEGVHMLSTGGMLRYARERSAAGGNGGLAGDDGGPTSRHGGMAAVVATETGMLHGLRGAAPDVEFVAANEAAHCRYMKMITLPKLRDSLRDGVHEVTVARAIADRARVPIERMVAIS
jgi:quinolinate synthase